jgi:hypothetical protein
VLPSSFIAKDAASSRDRLNVVAFLGVDLVARMQEEHPHFSGGLSEPFKRSQAHVAAILGVGLVAQAVPLGLGLLDPPIRLSNQTLDEA